MTATVEELRIALDGLGVGVALSDATGRIVHANDEAARLMGFANGADIARAAPGEIASRFEFLRENGEPMPVGELPSRLAMRDGLVHEAVVFFRSRDTGTLRVSRLRCNPVRGEDGAVRYLVNVFSDLTDERRRESELEVAREWLATALRSIGDAVITTDREGKVSFLNPVAETLTGWPSDDAKGKPLGEVFHILDETSRGIVESPVTRVLREGRVVGLANHTILVCRDGSERSIDDSAAPIRDPSGTLVGVVLVFRDVSVQRRKDLRKQFLMRATAELNSSLDYRQTLATVARLAVPTIADWCAVDILDDESGKIQRLAVAHVDPKKVEHVREIERKYPQSPDAPTGAPNVLRTGKPEMMAVIPPELVDAAAVDDEHLRILRALELRSYIAVPIRHSDRTIGVISLVMAESHRRYDEEDLVFATALGDRAAVAIENARLYREAQRLRAAAEAASRSKDEFLAMLGHELRNPLAPIVTALDLLDQRAGDQFERERSVIRRQVDHVVRLIDDLLDVSRIARGKIELAHEPVELAAVVENALEMSSPLLESRRHEVTTDVPFGLVVLGDRTRLAQVVANLLQNAAKYTPPGGHVSVRAHREGSSIVLSVRDDGVGISQEMLGRVFDLFAQERQAVDRAEGGLGLGLAIVKNLVTLHGGTVEAKSEGPGRGAEIVIRLPAARPTAVPRAPREDLTPTSAGRMEHVLVVDDNLDSREILSVALEARGHTVVTAGDGPAALEIARREPFTLGLLDLGLPGMTGYELAGEIRKIPGLESIRLIAITGYGQPSDRERSAAAGFDGHLTKPVTLEAVENEIARVRAKR